MNAPTSKAAGLGDVVAAATKRVGIKPCQGCQRRQALLNQRFPFRKTEKPALPPNKGDKHR